MAGARTLADWENFIAGLMENLPPAQLDPELLREVVAVLAYYKAERRGFEPGHDADDWLAAEREFLNWKETIFQTINPEEISS